MDPFNPTASVLVFRYDPDTVTRLLKSRAASREADSKEASSLTVAPIGFPSIRSFKMLGVEVKLNQSLAAVEKNSNDPSARARAEQAVNALEVRGTPSNTIPELAEQIARGNKLLGKTDQALKWAIAALKKSPNSEKVRELIDRIRVQKLTETGSINPITSRGQSNLRAAVSQQKQQSNLAPGSRVTWPKRDGLLIKLTRQQPMCNLHSR